MLAAAAERGYPYYAITDHGPELYMQRMTDERMPAQRERVRELDGSYKRHGVKFAVNSDAHATVHLANMRYGVGTGQRGWLTKDDVINTWPGARLRCFLSKDRTDRKSRKAG